MGQVRILTSCWPHITRMFHCHVRMRKRSASAQYDAFVTATIRTGPHSDVARRLLSRKDEGSASLRQAYTMSDNT